MNFAEVKSIAWKVFDERFGFVSVKDFGAVGDGTTDDSTAFTSALAAGTRVCGIPGETYGVSGNFTLPDACELEDIALKQLSPNLSSRRTLTKTSGSGPIRLRRVKVDKNGATTDGSISDAAGIWIANINDITLEDVEVTGNSKGTGIFLSTCNRVKVVRPYVHDMRWTSGSDPGTEQIFGIWMNACTDWAIVDPHVENLDGQIGAGAVRAYQTDGITITGCSLFQLFGGRIENCGEGLDVTGSVGNSRFSIIGTHAIDCDSYGFKFANSAFEGEVIGALARDCGLIGFTVSGAAEAALPNCEDITLIGCKSISIGSNGNWSSSNTAGFAVLAGSFNTAWPQGIRFVECEAIDEQGSPTMKYGFRSEPAVGTSTARPNRMFNCHSRGHTIAKTLDSIGDMWCSIRKSDTQSVADSTFTAIQWNAEVEDPYAMFTVGVSATDITIREDGLYLLQAQADFDNNVTGSRQIRPVIGGTPITGSTGGAEPVDSTIGWTSINTVARLSRGDVLTIQVSQDSGGPLNLAGNHTFLRVVKLAGRE